MSLLFGFIMAPQRHTSTFACRAVGENKPQKMNDFRRESFLLTHASTSRLSGFRVAKATRNLPAIRWLYVIYQYIRWVKKSTSFQFCAANLQKLFQTTIIPPPHFHFFLTPHTPPRPLQEGASFLGSIPTHYMPQLQLSTNTILSGKL